MRKFGGTFTVVLLATALAVSVAGIAFGADGTPDTALRAVVAYAADRLETAPQVAAAKFGTGRPIADPERERQVLDKIAADAGGRGLDPAFARTVFADQIEANKQIQRYFFELWSADPEQAPVERPELATIRPVIDRLNGEIVGALTSAAPVRTVPSCAAELADAVSVVAEKRRLPPVQRLSLAGSLRHFCSG